MTALMKKAVLVVILLIFTAGTFHFFYGEDHGTIRVPGAGNAFGNVHHHHGHATTCLCFMNALFVPEPDVWDGAADFRFPLATAGERRLFAPLGADILHPPNSSLV